MGRKSTETTTAETSALESLKSLTLQHERVIYLLKDTIERVGDKRLAIRDALAELGRGRPAFDGPLGPVGFDERGDLVNAQVFVGVARDGRMVMVEGQ